MRLDRWLLAREVGSRRTIQRAIVRGEVSIEGTPVCDPAFIVPEGACVSFAGVKVRTPLQGAIWHKPAGVLVTLSDPWGRPGLEGAASELLALGLHPVGRLDKDTTGLLPWLRDGARTQRCLHPRRRMPRRYEARVARVPADLASQLRAGVRTSEGVFCATEVEITGDLVSLTVHEGRYHMVRRMLYNAGAEVLELHRIAFGPFELGALAVGAWRAMTQDELYALDAR